jgi:hypothetical protein
LSEGDSRMNSKNMVYEDMLKGVEKHNPEQEVDKDLVKDYLKYAEYDDDGESEQENFEKLDIWWKENLNLNEGSRRAMAEAMVNTGDEPALIVLAAIYLGYKMAEAKIGSDGTNSQSTSEIGDDDLSHQEIPY